MILNYDPLPLCKLIACRRTNGSVQPKSSDPKRLLPYPGPQIDGQTKGLGATTDFESYVNSFFDSRNYTAQLRKLGQGRFLAIRQHKVSRRTF